MRTIKILRIIGFILLLCVMVTLFSMFSNSGDLTENDISRNGQPYPKSCFTLFENKIYATVAGSGYYGVEGADVATFSPFGGYESRNIAGDKNHVYCGNQILPDLQPKQTVYSGNGLYTDGKITYYCNAISEKNKDLNIFLEVTQILFSRIGLSKKPQLHLFSVQKLPDNATSYHPLLQQNLATDGQNVFYKGLLMKNAKPASMRAVSVLKGGANTKESNLYYADGTGLYYKNIKLNIPDDAGIYSFESPSNTLENYLYSPKSGLAYMNDHEFSRKNAPYVPLAAFFKGAQHTMFGAKNGIFYYDKEKEKIDRAGDNPFYHKNFTFLTDFVFSDGNSTLYLETKENRFASKDPPKSGLTVQHTTIKELKNVNSALWEMIGVAKNENGTIWQNEQQFFLFNALNSQKEEDYSVYLIDNK